MSNDVRIGVLGSMVAERHGSEVGLSPTERAVLTVLVAGRGREVGVDQIIDRVWGARPPRTVRKALQTHVVAVRRKLGHQVVATGPHGYRLAVETTAVDVWTFEAAVARGVELVRDGRCGRGAEILTDALALVRGTPWTHLCDADGAVEQHRFEEIRALADDHLAEARLELGRVDEAVVALEELVDAAPLRERRWALLVVALYRAGRRAESLRVFLRARGVLLGAVGIEPGEQLRRLEQRVLRDDPALARGVPVAELVA